MRVAHRATYGRPTWGQAALARGPHGAHSGDTRGTHMGPTVDPSGPHTGSPYGPQVAPRGWPVGQVMGGPRGAHAELTRGHKGPIRTIHVGPVFTPPVSSTE